MIISSVTYIIYLQNKVVFKFEFLYFSRDWWSSRYSQYGDDMIITKSVKSYHYPKIFSEGINKKKLFIINYCSIASTTKHQLTKSLLPRLLSATVALKKLSIYLYYIIPETYSTVFFFCFPTLGRSM